MANVGGIEDIQSFVSQSGSVGDMPGLASLLESAISAFGFDYYALVNHASRSSSPDALRLTCYPSSWQEEVATRGYLADDPVCAASERSAAAFVWSRLPERFPFTPRQVEVMQQASRAGIGDGFTIPVHIPGEYAGSCGFSVRKGRELPSEYFPAAQYLGCFAFEAARRLRSKSRKQAGTEETVEKPKLTRRQYDCVVLAARGKSDWDAGRVLGISHQTVHKHLEEAKRRFGVSTRAQLIVRALFSGQLIFGDILN